MVSIQDALSNMNLPTTSSVDIESLSSMVQELRELGFDAIRFASYRTAAKLRYIQKKSNFLLVDFWNVLEGIRDHGLNALDIYSIITVPKLEAVISSLYFNLNKRLPVQQQVDVLMCARYLLSWMLIAYDNEHSGRVRVFSVKVGLVTLCSGKLVDKLRYIFSQISESNGSLVLPRFSEYLQEVLSLPAMVLESPTFGYTDSLAATIFDGSSKISINNFLDGLCNDTPPCLLWLPLLHTMASAEEVNHGLQCNICKVVIQGFRYKCQRCSSYNMCQNCFWEGKSSDNHRTDHEVKEYSTCKASGKGLRSSFRKSLRCVPDKKKVSQKYPEEERPLNLSHIVPPSPLPCHNGFPSSEPLDAYYDQKRFASELMELNEQHGPSRGATMSSCTESMSMSESDEEHRLISRYAARLASSAHPQGHSRSVSQASMSLFDSARYQRDMINQLEARNREIMEEIARLRAEQEMEFANGDVVDPVLMEELEALRYHKSDLEEKLDSLQSSRNHLMGQLEALMKILKSQQQLSPSKSTPNSSPRSAQPMSLYSHNPPPAPMYRSAPPTPHHSDVYNNFAADLHSAFNTTDDIRSSDNSSGHLGNRAASSSGINGGNSGGAPRCLRNNLLLAADSVTNAMSSLVKELNSGSDDEENVEIDGHITKPLDFVDSQSSPEGVSGLTTAELQNLEWQMSLERQCNEDAERLARLRAQNLSRERETHRENQRYNHSSDNNNQHHLIEKPNMAIGERPLDESQSQPDTPADSADSSSRRDSSKSEDQKTNTPDSSNASTVTSPITNGTVSGNGIINNKEANKEIKEQSGSAEDLELR